MTTEEAPNDIKQSPSYTTQRTEVSLLKKKTINRQIWHHFSKRENYQRIYRSGSSVRKLRKPRNMKYVTIKKINGIAGNHKIFLNEFPRVSFKQKLQTTEVFMHAHVDARHIALSKLQSRPRG